MIRRLLRKAAVVIATGLGLADPRLIQAFGGVDSHSGKRVTVNTALQVATVWACVRLLAQTIATLPMQVYRRGADGQRAVAKDHPLYALLHDQPNADMTAAEFWEAMVAALLLWGNAYAELGTVGRRIVALTPLRPELMTIRRAPSGDLIYDYADAGGRRQFGESQILHVKGFSLDGLIGLSPVSQARHTLGLAMATSEAASKLYSNGMRSQGVMQSDRTLTDPQRDDAQKWLTRVREAQAKGEIPLIEAGFKYMPVSITPEDAQMLQTWSFAVEEICRWFNVPPFMVGHMQKSTSWGTGLEQQMIGFLTFSLRPHLTKIEQAVKRSLLRPEERAAIYAEFNLEGLMRADSHGRAALYATYAQNAIQTRNEMRERENLPPMPGGDVLTAQSNLLPLEMLGRAASGDQAQARSAMMAWLFGGELDALIDARAKALMGHNGGPKLEDGE